MHTVTSCFEDQREIEQQREK